MLCTRSLSDPGLSRQALNRCLRIEGGARVDGDRLDGIDADLAPGQVVAMVNTQAVHGRRTQIVVTRSPAGDLVCLATDLHAQGACWIDQRDWSIKCTFSSMKLRGFDLERTGITHCDRLERLFALVTLALAPSRAGRKGCCRAAGGQGTA